MTSFFTNVRFLINEMMNQEEFEKQLQDITRRWNNQDFSAALDQIGLMLPQLTDTEKSQCLLYSGMIKRDQGQLKGGLDDWLSAIPISDEGSYLRYSLQVNIGESIGDSVNSSKWYREAIITNAYGDNFSGARALISFLELNNGQIPADDISAVSSSLVKSWSVLDLPGKPKLDKVADSIRVLDAGLTSLVDKIVNEP